MNAVRRGYRRPIASRSSAKRVLICCEGERTEVAYFKGFNSIAVLPIVHGCRKNHVDLVEHTASVMLDGVETYDETWCVFDTDNNSSTDILQAISIAKRKNIRIACSNMSFELWILLHFNQTPHASSIRDYTDRLNRLFNRHFKCPYSKTDPDLYDKLYPMQPDAIKNGKRLMNGKTINDIASEQPLTNVHELVLSLI